MICAASPFIDISRATAISGWMSENELKWLAAQSRKRKHIVEFGSHYGRSSRALADNMMSNGKLWCVDPWNGIYINNDGTSFPIPENVMPHFYKNLQDHIDAGRVIPVREFSYNFSLPNKVSMVFIDGDHREKMLMGDIKKAHELLAHGGLICGHDYGHPDWPAVKQVVDKVVVNFQVEDSIWHAIKC